MQLSNLLMSIPENPTVVWLLGTAATGLLAGVIFLYKKNETNVKENAKVIEQLRDNHEERLLTNAKDLQVLMEKTILVFHEVEKNIITNAEITGQKVKSAMKEGHRSIIENMKELTNRKDGS